MTTTAEYRMARRIAIWITASVLFFAAVSVTDRDTLELK